MYIMKQMKQMNENTMCDICHNTIKIHPLRIPCHHTFHKNCFKSSLGDVTVLECLRCPICMNNIAHFMSIYHPQLVINLKKHLN